MPCARLARRVRVATREQISEQKARRSRRRLDGWPLEVPIAGMTSLVLIDSGRDYSGDMVKVASDIRRQVGRVDVVLSNLRSFHIRGPDYITNGSYWLSLSPEQMGRFPEMLGQSLTLGPDGVAEVCKEVGASFFLPYAHWWQSVGEEPEGEAELIEKTTAAFSEAGVDTVICPWNIGDRFGLVNQRPRVTSAFEAVR